MIVLVVERTVYIKILCRGRIAFFSFTLLCFLLLFVAGMGGCKHAYLTYERQKNELDITSNPLCYREVFLWLGKWHYS